MKLTIFYDGFCPLCMWEMEKLKRLDRQARLAFVDIQHPDFAARFPELDWSLLNARIHALKADGSVVTGLDVTYLAWQAVGKGWVYAPLRWPVLRWFVDWGYTVFARHRYRISYWLTGKKRCTSCQTGTLHD